MAYASWSVSFGEQPSAAKWNILGTNDAYFDTLVGSGTAWATWAVTWTNLTAGNGTLNYSKYAQIGKNVHFRLRFTWGSTTSASGLIGFSLPVTASSDYSSVTDTPLFSGQLNDASGFRWQPWLAFGTTSRLDIYVLNASVQQAATSSTVPYTWTTSDQIMISGCYESA